MRILFTSSIPYLPQIYGGLNTNTHELCRELIARGHQPSVLTRLSYGNLFGVRKLAAARMQFRRRSCDTDLGYPVYRARQPWTITDEIPLHDAAVMQDGHVPQFAAALQARGVPAIAYFHGLDFEDWTVRGRSATAADLPAAPLFANSEYTARRFNRKYGITVPVIPPVFRPELYRTARRGKNVVFINPVPEKGVDLALEIAASCPEIPFVFVKGWPIGLRDYLRLTHRISRLQNVRLVERRDDMREIFRECLMLLVPSKWQRETWGRVASEAHFSGIPVIGTKVGGLPEAIGPGGVVIEPGQAAATWVAAVRRLYHDEEFYQEKSRAALLYSQRPELQMHRQVTTLLAGLNQAISLHQSQTGQASWPRVRTA